MDLELLKSTIETIPELIGLIGSTDEEEIIRLSSGFTGVADLLASVQAYADNSENIIETQMNRIQALQKLNKELAMEKYAQESVIKNAKETLSTADEIAMLSNY